MCKTRSCLLVCTLLLLQGCSKDISLTPAQRVERVIQDHRVRLPIVEGGSAISDQGHPVAVLILDEGELTYERIGEASIAYPAAPVDLLLFEREEDPQFPDTPPGSAPPERTTSGEKEPTGLLRIKLAVVERKVVATVIFDVSATVPLSGGTGGEALRALLKRKRASAPESLSAGCFVLSPREELLIDAGQRVTVQAVLSVKQLALAVGFRTVYFTGRDASSETGKTWTSDLKKMVKKLKLKMNGPLVQGECLILVAAGTDWQQVERLLIACTQVGIYQMGFLCRDAQERLVKVRTYLPTGR